MIKVSVLYPNSDGCKFDMSYYLDSHMPMVQTKLGAACKNISVEQGLAGGAPGAPASYIAMGHFISKASKPSNNLSGLMRLLSWPTSQIIPTPSRSFRSAK